MLDVRKLDKSVPIPLYFQLKGILLDAIKNGDYPVNSMIPTEKELSEMFQISRTTVRQAITCLLYTSGREFFGLSVSSASLKASHIRKLFHAKSYNQRCWDFFDHFDDPWKVPP